MKMNYFQSSFFLFYVIVQSLQQELGCGIMVNDITRTISQGDETSNFAPWVVAMGFGKTFSEEFDPHCTGTILKG